MAIRQRGAARSEARHCGTVGTCVRSSVTANLYQQAHESEVEAELELEETTGTAFPHEDRTSCEWSERGSVAEDGGLVLAFRGINQDEQDRLDAQNFVRGLKAPARPDPDYEAIMAKS